LLLELAGSDPQSLGSAEMLRAYNRRHAEVRLRVAGIDALNRASMLGAQGLRDLRAGALSTLYSVAPVRKSLMRLGLGAR
ncbi:MAG: UbiH/UbiF family hydroxylase, partial [Halocynthiibacter sp.]